jgi:nicotinate-nucleotide pyrophosphorylase (carboxylating)
MTITDDIERFFYEDLNDEGDITSNTLFKDETTNAVIHVKESCVIAGMYEAIKIFKHTGAALTPLLDDGTKVPRFTEVAALSGPIRSILCAERLALNFLGRMSAIATTTRNIVDLCREINQEIDIAATRKTTPGFRFYEKKAVQIGGGIPHRFGLYDAVMIKDNHIHCMGSLEKAIMKVQENIKNKIIEVEVEDEYGAVLAASKHVNVIMLDNIDPQKGKDIAEKIRNIDPHIIIEVSGGITPENAKEYASFADRISMGYLTHTIKNKDFSLEIRS